MRPDLAPGTGPEQICTRLDANSHKPATACWRDLLRESGITHQSVSKTTFLLYPAAIGDITAA